MNLEGDIKPAPWQRIGAVVQQDRDWQPPEIESSQPLDPLTLAARLTQLARQYDEDAKTARMAAASCRKFASDLRAGC